MSQSENTMFEQECKYCGFAISVAKADVQENVECPRCGRPNLIGEGQPNAEEIVKEAGDDTVENSAPSST